MTREYCCQRRLESSVAFQRMTICNEFAGRTKAILDIK